MIGTSTQGTTAVKSGDISVAPVIAFFILGFLGILAFKRKKVIAVNYLSNLIFRYLAFFSYFLYCMPSI